MGLGSMILGDPEKRRREKQRTKKLQSKAERIRRKAAQDAYFQEQANIGTLQGKEQAVKDANKKPFYKKLAGLGVALARDIQNTDFTPRNDPFEIFPKQHRQRRRRRKR